MLYVLFSSTHIHVYFFSSTFISFYTFMCCAHKLIITKGRVDSKQLLSGSKSFTSESACMYVRTRVMTKILLKYATYENGTKRLKMQTNKVLYQVVSLVMKLLENMFLFLSRNHLTLYDMVFLQGRI